MAGTVKDIIGMINSGKHRPQKPRALAMPTKAFDGDDAHLKVRCKIARPKNTKLAKQILHHYRFPE